MKRFLLLAALLLLPVLARADDFEISLDRKRGGLSAAKAISKAEKGQSQLWSAGVVVRNKGFKPYPELEARYRIVVRRQQLGQKLGADQFEVVTGSAPVKALKAGEATVFSTKEIELKIQKLDPGWYYKQGGQTQSQDNIVGIWVKLFQGEQEVGEFVTATSLKEKYPWK